MPMETFSTVSYKSFNFIVNARTESCLQDVELGHEETVYLGSTLGLILNCFVKHYGSKFLISEQEALCLILEPYYVWFLVPWDVIFVLWCHLAIDHLFNRLRCEESSFSPSLKLSNVVILLVISGLDKLKKPLIKWYIFTILQNILTFSRELYWYESITSIVIYILNSINY